MLVFSAATPPAAKWLRHRRTVSSRTPNASAILGLVQPASVTLRIGAGSKPQKTYPLVSQTEFAVGACCFGQPTRSSDHRAGMRQGRRRCAPCNGAGDRPLYRLAGRRTFDDGSALHIARYEDADGQAGGAREDDFCLRAGLDHFFQMGGEAFLSVSSSCSSSGFVASQISVTTPADTRDELGRTQGSADGCQSREARHRGSDRPRRRCYVGMICCGRTPPRRTQCSDAIRVSRICRW